MKEKALNKEISMNLILVVMLVLCILTGISVYIAKNHEYKQDEVMVKASKESFDAIIINALRQKQAPFQTNEEFYAYLKENSFLNEQEHLELDTLLNTKDFLSYGIGSNKKDEYKFSKEGILTYYDENSNELIVADISINKVEETNEEQSQ